MKTSSKCGQSTVATVATVEAVLEPKESRTLKPCEPGLPFARILVAIDFSESSLRALDYALALAEPFGARLILLHVVEPAGYLDNQFGVAPALDETNQNLLEEGRERLAQLCQRRISSRVRSENLVRLGRAHSEIPDTAKALAADLIIMATHGFSGLKHALMGSTAERVVRMAPCPVLTVRQPANGAALRQ